jgi:hypothetical protein
MKAPTHELTIEEDGECILSKEVASNSRHTLHVAVDRDNSDVYFEFSSRQALYDFARSLLHEAVYGEGGQKEFYPLIVDGKELVVEGARLTEGSSRLFVSYSEEPLSRA